MKKTNLSTKAPLFRTAFLLIALFVVALGVLVSVPGCTKLNVKWIKYEETRCDKWTFSENNEVLKTNVESYLKGKGVKVLEIEIFVDTEPEANCQGCNCKTGRTIKIKIKKREMDEAKAEGFHD